MMQDMTATGLWAYYSMMLYATKPPLHGPEEEEIGIGVTSKVPDIPEPVTLKIRAILKN